MQRMTKQDPPRSSGVFKPAGHVLMVLDDQQAMERAESALLDAGFAHEDLIRYSNVEMIELCEDSVLNAGALASMGSEINLTRKHLELAHEGCWFLVVFAPTDTLVDRIREVALRVHARFAQRYGRLTIEELIHSGESPRA